ncbi:MAG TPA: FtsX-like permease family protein [Streptosporangiaceae bacterium]|nr:FtsX-like permease family protein [Streptosporangiaceae bacterium]
MRRNRVRAAVRALCGTAAASYLTLAVLVLGGTFIAVAGPRQSLHAQTQALQAQLAAAPQLDRAVLATADWDGFTSSLAGPSGVAPTLGSAQIASVTSQLAGGFTGLGLPLGPAAANWASLTSHIQPLTAVPRGPNSTVLQKLELIYRDPLTRYAGLVAGHYPGRSLARPGPLGIALSQQTAAELNAHVGTRLVVSTPSVPVRLVVTGIVRERQPGSAFWTADPTAGQPVLEHPFNAAPYWVTGAFVGPSELGQLQNLFGALGMTFQWAFPLVLTGVRADQAGTLAQRLGQVSAQAPALHGPLAPAATTVVVGSALGPILDGFLGTAAQVNSVLSLLFSSLAAIGVVVIVLAGWMLAERRSGEFTVLRARGATVRQLSGRTLRGTAAACVPAALAGAGLGILATPGEPARASWWLAGLALVTAVIAAPLAVAWQHRVVRPEHPGHAARAGRPSPTRRGRRARRLVAEVALSAAAVGGLVVLRAQGSAAGAAPGRGGLDLYTSLAPVLVAVPAVLLAMRLGPLAVRGLLRMSARRAGPVRFLGLAQAARAPAATVLPLFAVVLALTLAAFTGMLRDAVSRSETAASWRVTGADAVIDAELADAPVTPAAQRAATAVPGVRQATAVQVTRWTLAGHGELTVVAVNPASYATLLASTPWPPLRPAQRAVLASPRPGPGRPVPVLASPAAAAALRGTPGRLGTIQGTSSLGRLSVRVAGLISGTPALPGGGAFVMLPLRAAPGGTAAAAAPANLMLLGGGGIDGPALRGVARRLVPGAAVTLRSDVLASLAGAPLQHGAYVMFAVVLAAAAAFGLAALLADLALGAADRHQTLARLATMGVDAGQARRLVLVEKAPALLAAAVAGTACALVLPVLTAQALNLSVFTGTGYPVPVRADWGALVIPVAALLLVAGVAATLAAWGWRGGGVARALRIEG